MVKFKQIAICIPSINGHHDTIKNIEATFGGKMYTDALRMYGGMNGQTINVGLILSFHHNLFDGVEVELITSPDMSHWHSEIADKNGGRPFLSHFGAYCSAGEFEIEVARYEEMGFKQLQNTKSYDHSHPREDGSLREYQDVIFNSSFALGFNIKLTRKVV